MKCATCKSSDRVRVFAVAVDGELLQLQIPLCGDHGDRYLLLVGHIMGLLLSGEVEAAKEGTPRP